MSKICRICGKGPVVALAVARRGRKLRNGKERYITGKTKRRQLPNLQRVKLDMNGTIKRVRICTSCLTSKAKKAV
ncbi:MAG: 50S ribosomal protein L28 [Candidatus Poribacteria bacterium]